MIYISTPIGRSVNEDRREQWDFPNRICIVAYIIQNWEMHFVIFFFVSTVRLLLFKCRLLQKCSWIKFWSQWYIIISLFNQNYSDFSMLRYLKNLLVFLQRWFSLGGVYAWKCDWFGTRIVTLMHWPLNVSSKEPIYSDWSVRMQIVCRSMFEHHVRCYESLPCVSSYFEFSLYCRQLHASHTTDKRGFF